ncbi:MAG: GNAT family N-acetyltransferase [Trebonia sp.]|jgi:RimJ/RimL family protein N-acetyltransferase
MTSAATALPLLGLRITAGPVELRGITDGLIGPLADLAIKGVHHPDLMPFVVPWSLKPADELPRSLAQFHWGQRTRFSPDHWGMDLAVFFDGELVGSQGFHARDFLITRIGETGSWLGREFHGHGIGTAMRKVICAFVFDHLEGQLITSSAFTDNPASLAVSRKCGYTENGVDVLRRMDKPATLQRIILEPGNLIRYEHKLTVEGLPEFRRSIGLDA